MSADPSKNKKPDQKAMPVQEALAQAKQSRVDLAAVQAASKVIEDMARMLEEMARENADARPHEE